MIIDIILITIMALCVFLGYKRGLIKVAVKAFGFIVALIVSLILYIPISNYIINNTEIAQNISHTIQNKIYNKDLSDYNEEDMMNNQDFSKAVEKYIQNYEDEILSNGSEYISKLIATSIIKIRNLDSFIYRN